MRKNSQRKLRQAWMRRYRRSQDSDKYVLHRLPRQNVTDVNGNVVDTYLGRLYILKNDGRRVMQVSRQNGRVDNVIVKKAPVGPVPGDNKGGSP